MRDQYDEDDRAFYMDYIASHPPVAWSGNVFREHPEWVRDRNVTALPTGSNTIGHVVLESEVLIRHSDEGEKKKRASPAIRYASEVQALYDELHLVRV